MHSLVGEKESGIQDDPGPLKMGDLQPRQLLSGA